MKNNPGFSFLGPAGVSEKMFFEILRSYAVANVVSSEMIVSLLNWFRTRTHVFNFFAQGPTAVELNAETILRLRRVSEEDIQPDIDFVTWFSEGGYMHGKLAAAIAASMGTKTSRYIEALEHHGFFVEVGQFYQKPVPDTKNTIIDARVRHYPIVVCKEFRLAA